MDILRRLCPSFPLTALRRFCYGGSLHGGREMTKLMRILLVRGCAGTIGAIAILSAPALAQTPSRLWIRVMSDPQTGNNHYFDKNSVVTTTNEIGNYLKSFDSKIVFNRPGETGLYSAIVNIQVNCQNRTMRSLRFEQYDGTDSLIAVDNLSNEWYGIPLNNTPNAMVMNGFYTLACHEPD